MKNIVFLGGKEIGFTCLEYLISVAGSMGSRVSHALYNERQIHSNGKKDIGELCRNSGIPVLDSPDELVTINNIDILISVQYHKILKKQHLKMTKRIAVNLHMAPLPEYRGCNQFSFAILDGATEFGTTFHKMEERIDGGDILFERRFKLLPDWDVKRLYEKTFMETVLLFKEKIGNIIEGNYKPVPQNSFAGIRPTSFHLRDEIDNIKRIDLNWDKEKIMRHFRATYFPPFPPPYAMVDGKKTNITPSWIEKNIII